MRQAGYPCVVALMLSRRCYCSLRNLQRNDVAQHGRSLPRHTSVQQQQQQHLHAVGSHGRGSSLCASTPRVMTTAPPPASICVLLALEERRNQQQLHLRVGSAPSPVTDATLCDLLYSSGEVTGLTHAHVVWWL